MDEIYVTYVDDEHVDNHKYYDTTDDDHDNNNSLAWSGPVWPTLVLEGGAGARTAGGLGRDPLIHGF